MQNNNLKNTKRIIIVLFVLYVLAILFLLVIPNNYRSHNVFVGGLNWELWSAYVAGGFNLVPLRGITEQIGFILAGEAVARNLIYLAGNFIGFFPLGVFLPALSERQRKLGCFITTSVIVIIFIELLQLLTMRGSFDIDDVILNTIGALLGFLALQKLVRRVIGQEADAQHNKLRN